MSKIIVIAGRPKAGKSTKAKEFVLRALWPDMPVHVPAEQVNELFHAVRAGGHLSRLMVYDVNHEWGTGPLPTSDAFLASAKAARDKLVVFEEATLFFDPTRGRSEELREMLVRRRHTRTAVILLFHAIADVPLYVVRLADVLVLFKTQDSLDDLRRIRHLRPVLALFDAVNSSPDFHAFGSYDFVGGGAYFEGGTAEGEAEAERRR